MDTQHAYDHWAAQYDTNKNRTRDLEAVALRKKLSARSFSDCLEIGCGTGKNTMWLAERAQRVTAVDLSEEMLQKAKQKVTVPHVQFIQADITQSWHFATGWYDLVSFSLVLEHIPDLNDIFSKAAAALQPGGYVYIGELHPFKQYTGTRARFDTGEGRQVLECFTHHVSDFTQLPLQYGLELKDVDEFFDAGNRDEVPRILSVVLQKTIVNQ
ncbi:class I SAM-dependent methyltransferase [Chitinophaga alhagiae]|uniref:class I SAM-dependent methyltransferase n=1 Tax=Chitinophaga alhagiae TaxID=2203219 RepID=UPI000E5C3335|nr:class I SAM-dependent methyltransferase [Chitinophaga alhagiae]